MQYHIELPSMLLFQWCLQIDGYERYTYGMLSTNDVNIIATSTNTTLIDTIFA